MATDKPRITITLNPHVYATIKRMSELGGQPMSSIISELLDSVHDPFMRTVALLDAAAQAPKQVQDGLRKSFEAVEREVYGSVGYSLRQMDWLTEQLGKSSAGGVPGAARADRGATAAGGAPSTSPGKTKVRKPKANPHVVTRGSGIPPSSKINDLGKPKKGAKRG